MYQSRVSGVTPTSNIGLTSNESQIKVNCNLCGTIGSSVKCDRCDSKTFCLSCDDMYHRHPKRRFHLRKAISSQTARLDYISPSTMITTSNNRPLHASLQSIHSASSHSQSFSGQPGVHRLPDPLHHPSKMPIPPPRRKKKSLEDSTRPSMLPQSNQNRWMIGQPSSQQLQQQHQTRPEMLNRDARFSLDNRSGKSIDQQQLNYNYLRSYEDDYRRNIVSVGQSSNLSSANSSSLSSEQWSSEIGTSEAANPPALPVKKKWTQSLPRKNLSLMDLSNPYAANPYLQNPVPPMYMMPPAPDHPMISPSMGPYGAYMSPGLLAQSMEDLGLDDEASDEDYPDHGTLTRNGLKNRSSANPAAIAAVSRSGSMKRSQSSFMVNTSSPWPMASPYYYPPYPMYPGYPPHPLGPGHPPPSYHQNLRASPSPSLRSLSMSRKTRSRSSREPSVRSSVARESSPADSVSRLKRASSKPEHTQPINSNKQYQGARSGSFPRSIPSSRYSQDSELDEDEDEGEDDREGSDDDRFSTASSLEPNKWWNCRSCTFVNRPLSEICEMCGKSHPSRLKRISRKSSQPSTSLTSQIKSETQSRTNEQPKLSSTLIKTDDKPEVVITQDLIKEQLEIEKELKRRLENEKRIEKENKKLEKKEERLRRKSQATIEGQETMKMTSETDAISSIDRPTRSYESQDRMYYRDLKPSKKESLDDLDWPDSNRDQSPVRNRSKYDRAMSPNSANFQDIEATFEKLEREIDDIRNGQSSNNIEKEEMKVELKVEVKPEPSYVVEPEIRVTEKIEKERAPSEAKCDPKSQNETVETEFSAQSQSHVETEPKVSTVQQQATSMIPISSNIPGQTNMMPSMPYPQGQTFSPSPYPYMVGQPTALSAGHGSILGPMDIGGGFIPGYDPRRPAAYMGIASATNDLHNQQMAYGTGSSVYPTPSGSLASAGSMSHLNRPTHNFPTFDSRPAEPSLGYLGQMGGYSGKFMSSDSLVERPGLNIGTGSTQSQLTSGFQMFKLLRDAEKKGFTTDDIEMALNFNPTSPLEWLEENWDNMIETVLTLSNNQLVQNEKKRMGKKYKLTAIDLVTTRDAKAALRLTKGNIWQSIDKCVQRKEEDKSFNEKRDVKSFSLDIEESGSGKSNMDPAPSILSRLSELQSKDVSHEVSSSSSDEYFSDASGDIGPEYDETMKKQINQATVSCEAKHRRQLTAKERFFSSFDESEEIYEDKTTENVRNFGKMFNQWSESSASEEGINEATLLRRKSSSERSDAHEQKDLEQKLRDRGFDIDDYIDSDESDETKEREKDDEKMNEGSQETEEADEEENEEENEEEPENEVAEDDLENPYDHIAVPSEEENLQEEFEVLEDRDFDSIESDQWSDQSNEIEKNVKQDKISAASGKLTLPDINALESRPRSPRLSVDIEQTLRESLECLSTVVRQNLGSNTENEILTRDDADVAIKNREPVPSTSSKSGDLVRKKSLRRKSSHDKLKIKEKTGEEEISTVTTGSDHMQKEFKPAEPITDLPVIDKESLNPHFGYARSAYECELCAGQFHIRDMISMISCTHKACVNCARRYFSVQIRETPGTLIVCPFCSEPTIDSDDEDKMCDYLSLLDQLVKSLVPVDLHELFQRKVRDKVLSKDPTFRWCPTCSSGFIASNPTAKTITCPDCSTVTCTSCRKIWEDQHAGITCEQFTEWKRLNDPEYADNQLDLHLKQFGIDCPNCSFHYELSKGGCMHFHCVQCGHDFCGGCRHPFKLGSKCTISTWCAKLGLHAHHPRNCLFYLRDKEVDELRKLLDIHQIDYKYTGTDQLSNDSKVCMIMEQKEYPEGLKDMPCGANLETAGVCKQHYIEYLGSLIFEHNIDPIEIFTEDELAHVLRRDNVQLPTKKTGEDYRVTLCEVIKKDCPLIRETTKA